MSIARGLSVVRFKNPYTDELPSLLTQLYGGGQQGAMFIPKPIVLGQQTLFQDAAGTLPVTADGDPVGLMLDVSGNGNHASQSTSAARPLYRTDGVLHWLEGDGVDDCLVLLGTRSTLAFLADGTGATLQLMFECDWPNGALQALAGTAHASGNSDGLDMFIDNRSGAGFNRYRHVNPSDGLSNAEALDNASPSSTPTIFEYRQDSTGQRWSTVYSSGGLDESAGLKAESTDNDMRLFGFPSSESFTSGTLVGAATMLFYGGIMTSQRIADLGHNRSYLAQLAGVTL